ncbi:MAG: hypothetical protein Q8R13_01545 [bacterium]|nr:hypothetical protein [bacterium]
MKGWKIDRVEPHVKGRIAEALVETIFRTSGVPITHFGHQYRTLDFTDNDGDERGGGSGYDEVRYRASLAPDFMIRNRRGRHELIEVKYSRQGRFVREDIRKLRALERFWAPKLIVVSYNPGFRKIVIPCFSVIHPPYAFCDDGNPLVREDPLKERDWGITEGALQEAERLAVPLYDALMTPEQRKRNQLRQD